MIRVALVDDQAMIRHGLRLILESEPGLTVVGEAVDGRDALEMVPRARPDVVLMDVRMPRLDGIEACRLIRDAASGELPYVLMLTTFDLEDYVYSALRAGASGFLLKDVPPEELIAAVRIVAEGDALIAPAVTKRLIENFIRAAPPSSPSAELQDLTPREAEVLQRIARGFSNAEIADDLVVSKATVKTHVKHVLAKLGVRDRVQAVVFAYEAGLVSPREQAPGP